MENPFTQRKTIIKTIQHLVRSTRSDEEIEKDYELLPCRKCGKEYTRAELRENLYVCPNCGRYARLSAATRIAFTADSGTFRELNRSLQAHDPLHFPGYQEKLEEMQSKTHLKDAVLTGTCRIGGIKTVLCVMDSYFMMGSMGMAVGEKITRAAEYATRKKLPLIIFCCSGGARMQEGMLSLLQMTKTSAAVAKHKEAGLLYISVLTHPTTGGVWASFASLADIQLAEPDALIGFAGPRVIENTIGEKLPEGFQRAEFQEEHGFADAVVSRHDMRAELIQILRLHDGKARKNMPLRDAPLFEEDPELESSILHTQISRRNNITANADAPDIQESGLTRNKDSSPAACAASDRGLSAAERITIARRSDRPTAKDYIHAIFRDFLELRGDRALGEDASIIGGIATFHGLPVTVIGQQKGRSLEENLKYRFGMPNPEGYRKAERLMKEAEKFHRPVITFVDTPGAYPGKEAEEHGQGPAIASCIMTMSRLQVPTAAVFIGEGGSGGALALASSDRIIMLENSVFSILSPEGFASILWKDASRWQEAADEMKLTASDLEKMQVCDRIIQEPAGGAQNNPDQVFRGVDEALQNVLQELLGKRPSDLVQQRYKKFRNTGIDLVKKGER
jgi:acetyl-CoA carboxylase carboxyl transferase alpha subunit/acetyl-CoA carboxylase carboxyl transferase beta subunit